MFSFLDLDHIVSVTFAFQMISNLMKHYVLLGPLQPDGCNLSVLLTSTYAKEKRVIFSAFEYNICLPIVA